MKRIFIVLIICILSMFRPAGAGDIGDSSEYLSRNVVTRTLANGITVIMLNRGYAPTLAFDISFKVGSVDESYSTIGAAHLLEHMLFKGTDTIGTRDYAKEKVILDKIEAIGETLDRLRIENPKNIQIPDLEKRLKELEKELQQYVISSPYDRMYTSNGAVGFNAATSKDKTGYFVELPSSKLELWAKIESDRLKNAVFREFYTERNNVYEERLMRYDSSGVGLLYEEFIAQAFIAHPYRHPIIGWGTGIPFLSLRDMKKFYQEHYIPSRMIITIVGKQDIEKTFAVVSDHFGTIEKRPEPLPIAVKEPRQRGEKRFELYFESNPYIMIGWHKPTYPDRNDFVFDIISDILAGGKSSRLYRSLVLEKKMVSDIEISTGWPGSRYDNLFVIIAAPNNGYSTPDIEKAIYDELAHLAADVSEQEIRKVVSKIESEMVFGLSTNSGIAHLVSYYQTIFGDWRYAVSYLKIIRELTVSDVKQVVQMYLVPDNRTVGVLNDSRKRDK